MMRAILIAALGVSSVAWAQEQTPSATAAPKVKVERSASGQKIFRIAEGIVVEARSKSPMLFTCFSGRVWITIGRA